MRAARYRASRLRCFDYQAALTQSLIVSSVKDGHEHAGIPRRCALCIVRNVLASHPAVACSSVWLKYLQDWLSLDLQLAKGSRRSAINSCTISAHETFGESDSSTVRMSFGSCRRSCGVSALVADLAKPSCRSKADREQIIPAGTSHSHGSRPRVASGCLRSMFGANGGRSCQGTRSF